ncbi:MAG: hypothetical protein ABH857_05245 [Elusimicrobiota bacterium]
MRNTWDIIIDEYDKSAFENMAYDEALLKCLESAVKKPVLRFYGWNEKCYSYGYAQKVASLKEQWLEKKLSAVRRPTGGGIVLHEYDISYSLIAPIDEGSFPRDLNSSYKCFHSAICRGLNFMGIPAALKSVKKKTNSLTYSCFDEPVSYDIFLDDKKIVGSAQKRTKKLILQQGTIQLPMFTERNSGLLKELIDNVLKGWEYEIGAVFNKRAFDDDEIKSANRLLNEKYSKDEWNFKY